MNTLGIQQYITLSGLKAFDPNFTRLPNGNIVAIGKGWVFSDNREIMMLNLYRPIGSSDEMLSPEDDGVRLTDSEVASNIAYSQRVNTEVFVLIDNEVYSQATITIVTTIVVTNEDGTSDVIVPDKKSLNIVS